MDLLQENRDDIGNSEPQVAEIAGTINDVVTIGNAILESDREEQVAEAILTFSAISSYNREEEYGGISGKDALLGRKIPSVDRHVESCMYALDAWKDFFQGRKGLGDMFKELHSIFMNPDGDGSVQRTKIGNFRNKNIFISGNDEGIEHACFIPINHDKIERGISFIEDFLYTNIGKIPTPELIGRLHYYIVALHPFDDGNGRTARIMAISLGIVLGENYLRGFTFVSEKLRVPGSDVLEYDNHLRHESSSEYVEKIKERGFTNEYQADGGRILKESKDDEFEDMMKEIDIDTIGKAFASICEKVKLSEKYIRFLGEVVHEGKSLPGDHQLIWVVITKIIQKIERHLNNGVSDICDIKITNEIFECHIPTVGKKLKRPSVRNVITLVERLRMSAPENGITISIDDSFLSEAKAKNLMPLS